MKQIIDAYLARLQREVQLAPAQQAVFLEEARTHLEERVAHLSAEGLGDEAAAQQAVAEFGDARRIGATMTAVSPPAGQTLRIASGFFLAGLVIAPLCWVLIAFPAVVWYAYAQHAIIPGNGDLPTNLLEAASPQTGSSVQGVFFGGWWQLLLFLGVSAIIPFIWGRQAERRMLAWQVPGIAYGLGAFIGLGWAILPTWFIDASMLPHGHHYSLMSLVTLLLFVVSVGAAWAGAWWQRRHDTQVAARGARLASARPWRSAWLIALGLLTLGGAEVALFVGIRSTVSQPGPFATQMLAQVHQHVTFAVRQPGWLPSGMQLARISVHPLYDFHYEGADCLTQQWVWLGYANQNAQAIIREEYNRDPHTCTPNEAPLLASIAGAFPNAEQVVVNGMPGTYFTAPSAPSPGDLLQGTKFRERNILFVRDHVIISVSSDTLSRDELMRIADGLA